MIIRSDVRLVAYASRETCIVVIDEHNHELPLAKFGDMHEMLS